MHVPKFCLSLQAARKVSDLPLSVPVCERMSSLPHNHLLPCTHSSAILMLVSRMSRMLSCETCWDMLKIMSAVCVVESRRIQVLLHHFCRRWSSCVFVKPNGLLFQHNAKSQAVLLRMNCGNMMPSNMFVRLPRCASMNSRSQTEVLCFTVCECLRKPYAVSCFTPRCMILNFHGES